MNQIIEFEKTEAALAQLEVVYKTFPSNLSVKKNYEVVRAGIAELRGLRVALDKERLRLNADDQARIKWRNTEAKRIHGRLVALEDPMKEAKQAIDDEESRVKAEAAAKEAGRVAGHDARIQRIKVAQFECNAIPDFEAALQRMSEIDFETFEEFAIPAEAATAKAVAAMVGKLSVLREQEAERKRLDKQRLEQEAAEAKAKTEQDKIDKERCELEAAQEEVRRQKADVEAEEARIVAEKQAEIDRVAKEKQDKIDAEARAKQEEKDRVAAEERAAEEKKSRLERMKADRERFATDAGLFLSFIGELKPVMSWLESVQTDEAKECAAPVLRDLKRIVEHIQNSPITKSQEVAE